MKHLLIDKKIRSCSECVHVWSSSYSIFAQCDHPKRRGKLKSLTQDEKFPSWCPLPEVKK